MNSSNIMLIVIAEVAVLLLVVCIFLVVQNRSLRQLISQLKEKAQSILEELKIAKTQVKALEAARSTKANEDTASAPTGLSYLEYVDQQLNLTVHHHASLNSGQDIALDIEPEIPLVHRAPALRHALLLAEKEALVKVADGEEPNWPVLRKRYEQIFSFFDDFADQGTDDVNPDEVDALKLELENARKRVSNLEKFKQLYFELEDKWQASKKEAQSHFENLTTITADLENGDEISQALTDYHQSYNNFSDVLEEGVDGTTIVEQVSGAENSGAAEELRQLRAVAADQHRIIEGLQKQLMGAKTDEERHNVVVSLQDELQKQMRFVQESETCIQLLEDELTAAHRDIELMKSKLGQLPDIKADLMDIRKQYDEVELKYHNAISENRKLQKKVQAHAQSASNNGHAAEAARLRRELAEASSRYNELEEKFLDLKLQ